MAGKSDERQGSPDVAERARDARGGGVNEELLAAQTPGEPLRDPAELRELATHPGLCASCVHLRLLRSPRSTFARCAKAERDPSFPRYPRLPVESCRGFERRTGTAKS